MRCKHGVLDIRGGRLRQLAWRSPAFRPVTGLLSASLGGRRSEGGAREFYACAVGDLSHSPPRPIADSSARCESPEGAEPTPKHPLGDAAHAMRSAEWLLREAEEVLAVHDAKQDIFGGEKHQAGWRKQRNELAAKVNKPMTKKRRATASGGGGGGGASKKRTTANTGDGSARAKPNATPKTATGGGGGGGGASKKRAAATTGGGRAHAKANATPKAATGGGGRRDGKAEFCTSLPPHLRRCCFLLRIEGAKRGIH